MKLEGRVALITGGGRGIGLGCSRAMAEMGADIALTYRRDAESANAAIEELEKLGRRARAFQCDVSEEDQVRAAVAEVIGAFGRIDILVLSAGVASRGSSVRDTPTPEWRRLFDTHVMGSVWCCQAVIDQMREQGRGHIILITSVATKSHAANGAPYSMAKSAMESLMKALYKEEGPNGIRVNVIGPGLIETEMGRRLMKATRGVEDLKDLYATYPFGRVGQPEDIGNLAAFLCTDEGSYVNGQTIYVDGGGFERTT